MTHAVHGMRISVVPNDAANHCLVLCYALTLACARLSRTDCAGQCWV